MKIVIDIPEEAYIEIITDTISMSLDTQISVINAIQDGTPLPKGHGDLKDYDAIKSEYIRKMSVFMSEEERMDLLCTIVDEAEVVIEADKEVQDDSNQK